MSTAEIKIQYSAVVGRRSEQDPCLAGPALKKHLVVFSQVPKKFFILHSHQVSIRRTRTRCL